MSRTNTPKGDTDDVAALLDELPSGLSGPRPFKIDSMSEKTRSAIMRALARGVLPGSISRALANTPDAVDAKTIRRWMLLPENAAAIKKIKV